MSLEVIIITTLALLNVVQFGFWAQMVHTLVNKLMSRNYAEYVQVQDQDKLEVTQLPSDEQMDDDSVLKELNRFMAQ